MLVSACMSVLHIYRSSAGSGKTHTLVSAYLRLALAHPARFQEILAVTFTNQATKEMKQRILIYLHSLAQGSDSPVATELLATYGWEKPVLQKRAQALLSNILHHYDQFTVSTIDSFFQTIIRGFAKELGIQPGFSIQMDQEAVLNQLIDQIIASAQQDLNLQAWLVNLATHKLLQGKNWHFKKELKALGTELFKEEFILQEAALMLIAQDKTNLNNFLATLNQLILAFEDTFQALGKEAQQAIQEASLTIPDFAYGQRGVAGYLVNLQFQERFAPTQRAIQAIDNIATWYSKTSPNKQAIIHLVQDKLQGILERAISYYQAHHQPYYTALAIQHFIYALGIMTHLKEQLQDYRAHHHVMLVSDATNLLRQVIAENETPFIYEKIGHYYKHFLIDEFQDISGFQWQNIKPLINNSLAEGYDSLLVGDVKQSIYRWRGGNWRLLLTQLEQDIARTNSMTLNQNWRSKQHIIAFNNSFFTDASLALAQHLQEEIQTLTDLDLRQALSNQIQELARAYQDVYQQMPTGCLQADPGYLQITLLKDEETATEQGLTWQEQVKQRLPLLIESLQAEGFALQDIALLVRNHAEGKALFQTLLAYQHSDQAKAGYRYDAISAESLYLGHNPWVNILIQALKYLAFEKDDLAEATLTYLYQGYIHQADPSVVYAHWQSMATQPASHRNNPLLPERFLNEQANLQQLPLYERIAALVAIFQLQSTEAVPFIQAFQDAVLQYLQKESADTQAFLSWWERQGSQISLPRTQGQDAISIMTIHQAKGLQFKVVILPFCEWELDHSPQNSPVIWCTSTVPPFSDFPVLPLRYNQKLKDTCYVRDYYQERMQIYLDNLNLLYVAFTRPEERLYAFTKHPNKPSLNAISDLLFYTFTQSAQLSSSRDHTEKSYLTWDQHWDAATNTLTLGTPKSTKQAKSTTSQPYLAPFLYQDFRNQVHLVPRPGLLAEVGKVSSTQARKHELMAGLLTKLPRQEQLGHQLTWLQLEQGLSQAELADLKQAIETLWQDPRIQVWYDGTWTLHALLAPQGTVYQPNRIMIQGSSALVVSFLTSSHAYTPTYKTLQTASSLLQEMGYDPIQAYGLDIATQNLHTLCF